MKNDLRYEIKFILNEEELSEAFSFIKSEGAFKAYPDRNINSLYFDTLQFDSIRDNLAGISNRQKVRLRWYEKFINNEPAIFEIKKRIGRLGCKEKYEIKDLTNSNIYDKSLNEIKNILFENIFKNQNILDEIYLPTLLVNYDREYYETDIFRITLDKNISYSNVTLHNILTHYTPLEYKGHILELKFKPNVKDIISKKIKYLNLIPKRHSKYLVGMAMLGHSSYV
jgi:hypothetical protein